MKLFNSFLIAAAFAEDDESRKVRSGCKRAMEEVLEDFPIVGGQWECSESRREGKLEKSGKGRMKCQVKCDGAGVVWRGVFEYVPILNFKCSGREIVRHWGKKYVREVNAENPINCIDATAGDCENKAAEIISRQRETNAVWSCDMNEQEGVYSCELKCPRPTTTYYDTSTDVSHLVPQPSPFATRYGLTFNKCYTGDPEMYFSNGFEDGMEVECISCDRKMENISSSIENGSFVKNDDGNYPAAIFYDLQCDDGRVMAKYQCWVHSGEVLKYIPHDTPTWESQPCRANN